MCYFQNRDTLKKVILINLILTTLILLIAEIRWQQYTRSNRIISRNNILVHNPGNLFSYNYTNVVGELWYLLQITLCNLVGVLLMLSITAETTLFLTRISLQDEFIWSCKKSLICSMRKRRSRPYCHDIIFASTRRTSFNRRLLLLVIASLGVMSNDTIAIIALDARDIISLYTKIICNNLAYF